MKNEEMTKEQLVKELAKLRREITQVKEETDRKKAEGALQEKTREAQLYAKMLHSVSQPFAIGTPDGRLTRINPAFCELTGYSEEELLGNVTWNDTLTPPEWRKYEGEILQKLLATGEPQRFEKEYIRKDGKRISVELLMHRNVDAADNLEDVFGFVTDITDRKKAGEEKETLIHNMGERVKELQCLYSIAESIRTRETVKEIFMDIVSLIPPGWHYPDITRGKIRFEGQDYVTDPFEETEWRQTSDILIKGKRSGSVEVYYLEERPELDEGPFLSEERNLINGIAQTLSEAIERNQAEEELKKHRDKLKEMVEEQTKALKETYEQLNVEIQEKLNYQAEAFRAAELATLGELSAGVAHEINNPINGIINFAQILADKSEPESKNHEIANNIMQEGDRIENIVKSLLSFARTYEGEKSSVQINEVISEVISLSGAQLKKDDIKLTVDIPTDLPLLHANFQQLEQVLLNIINNARYAINEKYPDRNANKSINIIGERIAIDKKTIVRLTVSDNGVGIPYEILNKIMNPFFTTKPANKGTGLGLSISHGIIHDHGGTLQIDSVYGEFTNVIIDLPANIISA